MRRFACLLACGALVAIGLMATAAGCDSFSSSADEGSDARDERSTTPETGAGDEDGGAGPEAATLTPIYARSFGSENDAGEAGASVFPSGMVVDPSGGVALSGTYGYAAVDLGGATLPVPTGADAFLLRLDATGAHVVSKPFNASADQYGAALVGSSDKLYASFEVDGTMVFGGSDSMTNAGFAGKFNAATARFSGALVSSGRASFGGTSNVLVKSASLGAADSVISFGDWDESIAVNGASSVTRGPGKTGLFFVRSFILGAPDVVRTGLCADGTGCIADAIGTNPQSGESLAGGRYSGHIDGPDGGPGVTTAQNDSDAYLMKLDANLGLQWVMALRGSGADEVKAVASVPGTTDFVVAGQFDGSFEPPGQAKIDSRGKTDIFVLRVDQAGTIVWLRALGGTGQDLVGAITADAAGNVFLTGTFNGPTMEVGPRSLTNADAPTGLGTTDVFVAWLDRFGAAVYAARFGDGADDVANAIGLDAAGNVVVAGYFKRSIAFGSTTLTARGRLDMFVTKLHR